MISFILPLLVLTAPLTLDDGHQIDAPLLEIGQVVPSNGFLIKIGDIADIQATLTDNGCMVRVAEIKDRFQQEIKASQTRCQQRLEVIQSSLHDSILLSKQLQKKLDLQKEQYNRLLFGSVLVSVALTTTTFFLVFK